MKIDLFCWIFIVSSFVMVFIRYPYVSRQRQNRIIDNRRKRGENLILMLVFIGMSVMPGLYFLSPFLNFADYAEPWCLRAAGSLLVIPTIWLFRRSHKDLDANWSISMQIRQGHTLITNGVYRHIRHPMYLSGWLWGLCQALLLPNALAGWSGLVSFGLLYFLRVHQEEKMMLEAFGSEYSDYCSRTGRIFPRICPNRAQKGDE